MTTAFLALGSNLDSPQQQILEALAALKNDPQITVQCISSLYQTPAMGPPQDDYINAVMHITTHYSARELLQACLAIEQQQGRLRLHRWGPRRIDIDILLYGDTQCQENDYILPHPGLTQRLFVLVPLYEIAPQWVLPNGTTIASLLQRFSDEDIATIRPMA